MARYKVHFTDEWIEVEADDEADAEFTAQMEKFADDIVELDHDEYEDD